MMRCPTSFLLCCSITLVLTGRIWGFAPRTVSRLQHPSSSFLSSTMRSVDNEGDDEDDEYRTLLRQAREYSLDNDGSSKNNAAAKGYLWNILELESACVSGNLLGEDDLCAVEDVADIVIRLREKAIQAVENPVSPWETSMIPTSIPPTTVGIATSLFVLFCLLFREMHLEATPFTMEEWMWAAKGGYVGDMVEHYLRNGGV